jgi:ABC-type thiamine transport system ATPase subunit
MLYDLAKAMTTDLIIQILFLFITLTYKIWLFCNVYLWRLVDGIIMVLGETGAGKSCLLNLLLGELSQELLSVSNLPSTSAMCEIKYGEKPMLKVFQVLTFLKYYRLLFQNIWTIFYS